MNPKSILFVYSHWQSFVREDFHLLSDEFKVKKLQFDLNKSFFSFFAGQLMGVFNLLKHLHKHEVCYIWFCDYHAFWTVLISKIFRKKSIIVVGGFDAVRIPSISYGLFMQNGLRQKLAKWAYKNCDRIIAVDASLIKGENAYAGPQSVSGVAHFVEGIEAKSQVIPTGYDDQKWLPQPKLPQVLTVALIKDQKVFDRKGIKLFLEVAKSLPGTSFFLVGLQNRNLIPDDLKDLPNVRMHPILPQEELIQLYATSKVYVQFSLSEGLPNVLCEAMMSGCVPVGSSANGIPRAIGDCGFILHQQDPIKATELVQQALNAPDEKSDCARKRIQQLFPKDQRRNLLIKLINEI